MQQDLFLQREELVQAHQLGELQKDYTIRFGKQIAIYGVVGLLIVFITLILTFFVSFARFTTSDSTLAIIGALTYSLFVGTVLGVLGGFNYYFYRRLHVYVYTGGLIYMLRKKRKAVRWEQINNVYRGSLGLSERSGGISIDWDGPTEPTLHLTSLIDDIGTLYSTIKRKVDNLGSSV